MAKKEENEWTRTAQIEELGRVQIRELRGPLTLIQERESPGKYCNTRRYLERRA